MFFKFLRYVLMIVLTLAFLFFIFLLNTNFFPLPRVIPDKNAFFIKMFIFYGFLTITFPCFLYSIYSCWPVKNLKEKFEYFIKKFILLNLFLIVLAYLLFRLACVIFGDNGF